MINYKLLENSIEYYSSNGFTRVETPWLVTEAVDSITRPVDAIPYIVTNKNKNLIASGEQGFLYLYLKEYLPMGKFQTTTPCFRNDSFDFTHTKYFMKNELIQTYKVNKIELEKIVSVSKKFFDDLFTDTETNVISTNDGFDIMIGEYELGSYGIRESKFLRWIYGTGCAEPRTSKIITLLNGVSY
jgi:seryl-tRNA synthetase